MSPAAASSGWVIEAIEREAMKRAGAVMNTREWIEANLMVYGVTLGQVAKLIEYYEAREGRPASSIGAGQ